MITLDFEHKSHAKVYAIETNMWGNVAAAANGLAEAPGTSR
jgi:hypothetical protein